METLNKQLEGIKEELAAKKFNLPAMMIPSLDKTNSINLSVMEAKLPAGSLFEVSYFDLMDIDNSCIIYFVINKNNVINLKYEQIKDQINLLTFNKI